VRLLGRSHLAAEVCGPAHSGPKGPNMTWVQRVKAGVDAKHFQDALKGKILK
jgi:hypothetical protein